MLMSDRYIRWAISCGELGIDPFDASLIGPSSIDMRLGDGFAWIDTENARVRVGEDVARYFSQEKIPEDGLRLSPGEFVLASTLETVSLPGDVAARLEGKSSIGRMGLSVHVTAGFIDPGFHGQITLEMTNVGNFVVELHPGDRIGQLCLFTMTSPVERQYGSEGLGSRYQGQMGPTPARPYREPPPSPQGSL